MLKARSNMYLALCLFREGVNEWMEEKIESYERQLCGEIEESCHVLKFLDTNWFKRVNL